MTSLLLLKKLSLAQNPVSYKKKPECTRIRQTYPTLAVVISLILLSFSGQFQSWRDGDERFGCGVPWKAIGMAFLLFGLGTFLLVLGLLIHTGHVENDKEEDR